MRKFTKTHNDLKWLFPIAKTKKEAEKVFNYVEEQANELADIAGVNDGDRDLAIDCFMKGYSYCMQLEIHREVEKAIKRLYLNLFNIKKDYGKEGNKKEWDKYFRFHELEDLFRHLAWDSKEKEGLRKELVKLLEKSIFDSDALVQNLKSYLKAVKKTK
jgi:hypothetical protein